MRPILVPSEVREALDRGATVALSVSGGKDSQAMAQGVLAYLRREQLHNPVLAVHADLGRAEWFDTPAVVEWQAGTWGVPLHVVRRKKGDLLSRIQDRAAQVGDAAPFWPSPSSRYCTSDLKRDPIDTFLRSLPTDLVISVEGIRAEESTNRASKPCWEPRKRITTNTREALTWRPIHDWLLGDVWHALGTSTEDVETRREAYRHGLTQDALWGWSAHPAYVRGNERLSCSVCILASRGDMERGAHYNPAYMAELVALEERYGWTFTPTTSLVEMADALKRGIPL